MGNDSYLMLNGLRIEKFIEEMKSNQSDQYLELDKNREIYYMETQKYRFKKIISTISKYGKRVRILDIGATPFTIFLKKTYSESEVYSVDKTDLMKQRMQENSVSFKKFDIGSEKIQFEDNYFDIIIFTEVLEHLFVSPTIILKELKRVLKNDGVLIMSVPNIASLYKRLGLLIGKSPLENMDDVINNEWAHGHGHIHEYSMGEMLSLLKKNNFKIIKKSYIQPGILDNVNGLKSLLRSFYYFICLFVPFFRTTIFIECRK
jgi:SAM-dependent methyltransferase